MSNEFWVGVGVEVGPDGVPRGDQTGNPIGGRGTRVNPDGSLQDSSGNIITQEDIDAANTPSAALQATPGGENPNNPNAATEATSQEEGGSDGGLSTGAIWGISMSCIIAALCALACCAMIAMRSRKRGGQEGDTSPVGADLGTFRETLTPRAVALYQERTGRLQGGSSRIQGGIGQGGYGGEALGEADFESRAAAHAYGSSPVSSGVRVPRFGGHAQHARSDHDRAGVRPPASMR